jgi:hypothetical protein
MPSPPHPAAPDRRPAFVRAWDAFFFTPADPRPLALVRIAVGSLLVWNWIWLGVDLGASLGTDGWADPELVRQGMPQGAWSIWLSMPDALLVPAWSLGLIAMVALTIGLASPVAAVVSWAFVVSTMRRVPVMLFGFDNVMAVWTLYLAVCGASGQAYSLDRWIARRRRKIADPPPPTVSANLGLRLIQLHLCLIYASAGLAKLQGVPWWDGSALGMLLGNSDFRPFDFSFLSEHPRLLEFGTHATVILELLYPILIWFRGWRPWMLAAAALMHAGIALGMGLTEFSMAMVAGNLAFVPSAWLDRIGRGRGALGGVESHQEPAHHPGPAGPISTQRPSPARGRGKPHR